MDKFLKINNFKSCIGIFKQWMKDNYSLDVESKTEIEPEKALFEIMKVVKQEHLNDPNITIKDLNNIALNRLQDDYVDKMKLSKKIPTTLDRDKSVFGNRQVLQSAVPMPTNLTNKDYSDVNKQLELMMASRGGSVPQSTQVPVLSQSPIKESPIPEEAFAKMLSSTRDEYLKNNIELQKPMIPSDLKVLYQMPIDNQALDLIPTFSPINTQERLDERPTEKQNAIINTPSKRAQLVKYISVNGIDRKWDQSSKRCSFSIDMSELMGRYKNITYMKFNTLIIPNEIIESRTIVHQANFAYHHDHKLAYPYLLLKVDEISDVYDGLNKNIQDAAAQFVYDNAYKCPNGRGYIIMKSSQAESKVYGAQNQSSFQKLTFSVLKPNGTYFNNSIDNFSIFKIDYLTYNPKYLQIITDKFFDKNDFFVGDMINMTNFVLTRPNDTIELSITDYTNMANYINRSEGHEIVQIGDANCNGFYKSFFILAPGILDQVLGKLEINKKQVDALRDFNSKNPDSHCTGNGRIMNTSLQITISFTIGINICDVSLISNEAI